MGQIYLDNDEQFEATDIDGNTIQISLRGGCNHPVSKLICLGNGEHQAFLASGIKINRINIGKVGRRVGKIEVEKTEPDIQTTNEAEAEEERKRWFEGFGGSQS